MSRIQLALNVSNIDEAVEFYETFFNAPVTKRRPGYANFAISEPPLKLVLIERPDEAGQLNHLGIEVASPEEVAEAKARLGKEEVSTTCETGTCCYAVQDKIWAEDPDGAPWEIYTVLADATERDSGSLCCT